MSRTEMDVNGFPEPTPEDYAAFERDMADMAARDTGPSDADMDAMYQAEMAEWDKKFAGKSPTELLDTPDVKQGRSGAMAMAREYASAWCHDSMNAASLEAESEETALDMDRDIFDVNGEPYGGVIPAYESQRLSAGFRQGETAEERLQRARDTWKDSMRDIFTDAAKARQKSPGIIDEDTVQMMNGYGFHEVELAVQSGRQGDWDAADRRLSLGFIPERKAEPVKASAAPSSGRSITFDAAKPVTLDAGQRQDAVKQPPQRVHAEERNKDRLPVRNNYTPDGVEVYNRAIPNDSWSFDEFDHGDEGDEPHPNG